jgi:hypothetical protein
MESVFKVLEVVFGSLSLEKTSFGGIAQLGERLLCKQEVIGSIPFTSTTYIIVLCMVVGWWVKVRLVMTV